MGGIKGYEGKRTHRIMQRREGEDGSKRGASTIAGRTPNDSERKLLGLQKKRNENTQYT